MNKSFFDITKITDAVDRANAKALQAGGAYIMTVAKNSIRPASGPNDHAAPNTPPKDHFGAGARIEAQRLRKKGLAPPTRRGAALGIRNIQFDLSNGGQSLIVGMIGSNNNYGSGTTIPELFEKGGVVVNTKQKKGKFAGKTLHYAPHPAVTPAFRKAITTGKLRQFWKDSVK